MLNLFTQHKMSMDKTTVVISLLINFFFWKDFKRNLTHKEEKINIENLANSLHVEKEFRLLESKETQSKESDSSMKVNISMLGNLIMPRVVKCQTTSMTSLTKIKLKKNEAKEVFLLLK